MTLEIAGWIFGGLLVLALFFWDIWDRNQRTRFIQPGAVFKRIAGEGKVTVIGMGHQNDAVRYTSGSKFVFSMSFTVFNALYELESLPYSASQKPLSLSDCAVIPPKKDTLS